MAEDARSKSFAVVTPNPDLDLTLRHLGERGEREREVELAAESAGGKGFNVARFLAQLGHPCTALGFRGGWVGDRIEELLRGSGVRCQLTPIQGVNRMYLTISDAEGRREASYHTRGPRVHDVEVKRLLAAASHIGDHVARVVIAGSVPPDAGQSWYERAVAAVGPERAVVDTAGENLQAALRGGARRVKVNLQELGDLVARGGRLSPQEAGELIAGLAQERGMELFCVTLGSGGAIAWTPEGLFRASGIPVAVKNTLGAGDAFLAGLLHAEAFGGDLTDQLRWGTAAGAAVCEQIAPQGLPVERVKTFAHQVVVQPVSSR